MIKNGALLPTPFVTLTVDSAGERGLLGIAFDPAFASNHFVYVYYTATTPAIHNRISRFTANGDVAVAGSEIVILDLDNLSGATNHNGGALHFGPDGKLYVAVGENANGANAQSLNNRARQDAAASTPTARSRPTTRSSAPPPGTTARSGRSAFATRSRSPSTRPAREMFINDVGQSTWEEINDGGAGANYGWPTPKGRRPIRDFASPRYAYNHSTGGCAITGGAFYSPLTTQFPAEYAGDYFFADYCGGWIRRLDPAAGSTPQASRPGSRLRSISR